MKQIRELDLKHISEKFLGFSKNGLIYIPASNISKLLIWSKENGLHLEWAEAFFISENHTEPFMMHSRERQEFDTYEEFEYAVIIQGEKLIEKSRKSNHSPFFQVGFSESTICGAETEKKRTRTD